MFPTQKSSKKFHCEKCDFYTSRKSQYDRHLQTDKHKILQNPTHSNSQTKTFKCVCGKIYKHSSTLYAHKKNCVIKENSPNTNSEQTFNQQVIETLIKIFQNGTMNNSNNTNISNNNNKTFNLNFFLHLWTFKTPIFI